MEPVLISPHQKVSHCPCSEMEGVLLIHLSVLSQQPIRGFLPSCFISLYRGVNQSSEVIRGLGNPEVSLLERKQGWWDPSRWWNPGQLHINKSNRDSHRGTLSHSLRSKLTSQHYRLTLQCHSLHRLKSPVHISACHSLAETSFMILF